MGLFPVNWHVAAAKTYPDAGMTVLIGLVVVFGVLLLLTFIFWLFGIVAGGKKRTKPADSVPSPTPAVHPIAPAAPNTNGVPDEVVAVIAAAIASLSEDGHRYTVRRIRPASGTGIRPVWAAAGLADNTRPF